MVAYYFTMFFITIMCLCIVVAEFENRKTNFYYVLMIMLMSVSNAGYLAMAVSKSVEEIILAQKIVSLGGCFILPLIFSLMSTLNNYIIILWKKIIIYGYSVFVYALVLTIGYNDFYYKDVYLKSYKDAAVMGYTSGLGEYFFYLLLIGHVVLEITIIVYTLVRKRTVSRKNLIGLTTILIINVYLFIMGGFINPSVEVMPIAYVINSLVCVYMYRRGMMYNFDDIILDYQKKDKNAYIMFDEYMNFLGCNDTAKMIFPQLIEGVVDKPLDNEIAAKCISSWIQEYEKGENEIFEYESNQMHYECEVGRIFHRKRHRGYIVEMRDDTASWKYMNLVSHHNDELEYEVEKQIRISKQLEEAKKEAESANEAKNQFLARMSHEIRTPINAVIGFNEMILRESEESEIKTYAGDIRTSATTLLGLVNEILDTSKIDAGMMEILPQSYDVSSLLNDLYNMIVVRAKGKALDLVFEVDKNIPCELYGDDIRIKQILINLLSNAVKYTKEGSVTLKLSSKVVGSNVFLSYRVIDTGVGIKQEDFKKLFGKFERIDEAKHRHIEGTGLGLNIASRLLSLMDSELKVKSELNKGSEFYFDLKQKIVNIEPLGEFQEKLRSTENEKEYEVTYRAPEANILIVDDNAMNRNVFMAFLKPTEIRIQEAASGEECIARMKEQKFDIVFLDHMMPGMDGVETFQILKEKNLCIDTPVIMFTANVMLGEQEKYLKQGFKDFLAKPLVMEELDELILKFLPQELILQVQDKTTKIKDERKFNIPLLDEFDFEYAMKILKSEELFMQSLANFKDMLKMIPEKLLLLMDEIEQKDALANYRIEVHSLKSSSATVGALLLSKTARLLEVAAIEEDVEKIKILNPILLEEMDKHLNRVMTLFPDEKKVIDDMEVIVSYLDMLEMVVEQEDYDTMDLVMEELKQYQYSKWVQGLVDRLSAQVINLELTNAVITIEEIKNAL